MSRDAEAAVPGARLQGGLASLKIAAVDWTLALFLDPDAGGPTYLRIAQALVREIERGRLKPGDALPGYRTLAEQLGVSRNTVMAAYGELQQEGWIASRPGEGTVVTARPPARLVRKAGAPQAGEPMGFALADAPAAPAAPGGQNLLEAASGVADLRLLPSAAVARAYRRALLHAPDRASHERDPQGHRALREALAALLSGTRAIAAAPERVLVTRGSQMALVLAAQALLGLGDAVAVEALGGRGAWEAFARAGARCVPVPVDEGGMRVEELPALLAKGPLRAVLVTPQRQYPTLAVLSAERRTLLLGLAARHRFAVLEIDQDSELHFDGQPAAPLASQDERGVVVHLGTLSKIVSPDLRLGFVHGPRPLVRRMGELRAALDGHGDPALERALAELMEDGELQRHLHRSLRVYRERRDALVTALRRELSDVLSVDPPAGGLALWCRVRAGVDVDAWAARALERGVAFRPGRHFAFDGGPVAGLRVGFSRHAGPQLEEIAHRMRSALPA